MFRIPQDNLSVSPEYNEFIQEYYTFLKYSMEVSKLLVLITTLKGGGNTQLFFSRAGVTSPFSCYECVYTPCGNI
ncbi:hypothetical protein NUACC26_032500 [Scytonema sp. NUACC26]